MPISITNTTGGVAYANPFVGQMGPTVNLLVDVSTLNSTYVDDDGYIKPGTPLEQDGDLATAAGTATFGVVFEPVKVGSNGATDLATDPDVLIAVATSGLINRDIAEDNIGGAYTADQITSLGLGGFKLTTT